MHWNIQTTDAQNLQLHILDSKDATIRESS